MKKIFINFDGIKSGITKKCFGSNQWMLFLYQSFGISVRSVQPNGRTWMVSPKGNPV